MKNDSFAAHLGVELLTVEEGRAVARMRLEDKHRNFMGTVHGGAVFSLADVAFSAAANSHGNRCMAFHISIDFLGPPGDTSFLEAEVQETGRAGRAGHFSMEVRNDSGETVAVLDGWAYQTNKPL
jgi:acyl-CoA thioesterase